MATTPVGTSAYLVENYVPGSEIIMKDTGNYWQTDESLIHGTSVHNVSEIKFSVITEASQHTVALQTGAVDISNGVPDTDIEKFRDGGEFSEGNAVGVVLDNLSYDVEYNMSDSSVFKDDENLRLALAYAIDKEGVNIGAFNGNGMAVKDFANATYPDYNPEWDNEDYYDYDVDKAKEYLAQSNYDGSTLRLEYINSGMSEMISQLLQAYWGQIGVNVELIGYDQMMELKNLFPAYVNSLHLKDAQGNLLTLDQEGHGSFEELIKQYIMISAQRKLDHPNEEIKQKPAPESDIHQQESLTIIDGKVTAIDLPAYVKTITRMKKTPAFDALDLHSPENEEFGTETVFARHFTAFSREHSTVNGDMAEDSVIKMLNPVRYIGEADTAKYWRIRHGSFDRDTSLAIPVILAVMLENAGCQVDFHLPWGLPHSGDYDLPQLFAWIDEICR